MESKARTQTGREKKGLQREEEVGDRSTTLKRDGDEVMKGEDIGGERKKTETKKGRQREAKTRKEE